MNQNLTFLLIDDDEDDRELFEIALKELNHKPVYHSAASCCKALELLEGGEIKPDYIFLDLNMPQMSGCDCLTALKKNLALSDIPVIIFSTSSDQRDKHETKEMGAVDFITKPPKTSELTIILNQFIINRQETSHKK